MSLTEKFKEVESINTEIKNLNNSLKKLRSRKKILENEIQNYIESKSKPGFKYKGER